MLVWSEPGSVANLIDSGNTVGDLVSEEFAERLGLEGKEISDQIVVPTAAAATTLLVIKKCLGVTGTARLAGVVGEFTIRPLVVRGLTQPVNLGQHFLGFIGAAWISPRGAPSWVSEDSQCS